MYRKRLTMRIGDKAAVTASGYNAFAACAFRKVRSKKEKLRTRLREYTIWRSISVFRLSALGGENGVASKHLTLPWRERNRSSSTTDYPLSI
jgi:hypothetical protein